MTDMLGSNSVSDGYNQPYTPTTELIRLEYSRRGVSRKFREEIFDRWLAEVKAEAWDYGHDAGVENTISDDPYIQLINPYRQGETE